MSYIEETLYKELGLLLRSAREATGLTLAEAANKLGVTTMTIQRYEKGERKISIEKIRLLCDAYSVSADDLMSLATSKAHSGVDAVSIISKDDTDSPTSAIVNIVRGESLETQMRIFDVVCDFLISNDYDRGRIAAYANMLAAKGVDTSAADREVDKVKADFYARYNMVAEPSTAYSTNSGLTDSDIERIRKERQAIENGTPAKKTISD